MKPQNDILEPGCPETDFFYYNMPATFRTRKALELFTAAERAGLLCWAATNQSTIDNWHLLEESGLDAGPEPEPDFRIQPAQAGPIKIRAQLAYWCKLASSYLGIDRGATTNWKPFEILFGKGLKGTLHDIRYTAQDPDDARQEYTRPIDEFFATLNTSTNEQ